MTNKPLFTFISCFTLLLTIGCSKDQTPGDITPLTCEEPVSFQSDVMTLIMSSCATSGCHNEASASSGYSFTSYQNIETNKEIMLKTMRKEPGVTPMPIGQELDPASINLFECWIEQGAKNN